MAGHALAQVTFQLNSGLPEDVVVNTFHFRTSGPGVTAGEAAAIVTDLTAFYNATQTGPSQAVAAMMSTLLTRTASTIKVYDMSQAIPRVPLSTTTFTLGAAVGTVPIPNEVALCLSYKGAPTVGVPLARSRGRIFLGPLMVNVLTSFSGDARPSGTARDTLRLAGAALMNSTNTDWSVFSPKETAVTSVPTLFSINQVSIDDAMDTQRRRGRVRTLRETSP